PAVRERPGGTAVVRPEHDRGVGGRAAAGRRDEPDLGSQEVDGTDRREPGEVGDLTPRSPAGVGRPELATRTDLPVVGVDRAGRDLPYRCGGEVAGRSPSRCGTADAADDKPRPDIRVVRR